MKITKEKILADLNTTSMLMTTKEFADANRENQYEIFATVIKSYLSNYWGKKNKEYRNNQQKQVYFFSLEFLLGKMLNTNIINLGIEDACNEALKEFGLDLKELEKYDNEPGLGNGGLGRVTASFLDSMASLGIPGHGCGIRYDYGLFEQKIVNGEQIEGPDNWLRNGFVWEIKKVHQSQVVKYFGNVTLKEINGRLIPIHTDYDSVLAVPYDIPILGYHNKTVNNLRLWQAQVQGNDFDLSSFSYGTFSEIDKKKREAESISRLLYPDDTTESGSLLRLKQEYFLVSAGLQSIISYNDKKEISPYRYPELISIQINDSQAALCVAEFMRILVDEKMLEWSDAWDITTKVMSYTNHSTLAKTSEKWEIEKVIKLLPRIYMIIEEINRRFCDDVYKRTNNWDDVEEVSIIRNKIVDMTHLAIVGSHSINGVSKLHTELLKTKVLKNFYKLCPDKFNNKTNGISHRRWLLKSNKELTNLIDSTISEDWKTNTLLLEELVKFSNDKEFGNKIREIKIKNKNLLADFIFKETGIEIDRNSIFDVHIKRLHGYKRQILNILYIMYLYNEILEDENFQMHPRTFIFSAKSASGYYLGKRIIKLIHSLGEIINNDPRINKFMKVVFVSNYNVTKAEILIPGSDVSEQISAVGTEASGTSNMKFMMNGAITIGTLAGTNIEIKDKVGSDNIFIFGTRYKELKKLIEINSYNPWKLLSENSKLKRVVEMLRDGTFGIDFSCIYSYLVDEDLHFVLKDFNSYLETQEKLEKAYTNHEKWNSMVITNIAYSGYFSSDNTIKEYAKEIWHINT